MNQPLIGVVCLSVSLNLFAHTSQLPLIASRIMITKEHSTNRARKQQRFTVLYCRRRSMKLPQIARGGAADHVFKAGAGAPKRSGSSSATSKIQSAMSQYVQASVALQLRHLTSELARKGCTRLSTANNMNVAAQHPSPTEAQAAFSKSHVSVKPQNWAGLMEEAPSPETYSDMDSIAECAWPEKVPFNIDKSEVVCSLAQSVANKHQTDLRERARGGATWNMRVAEAHHRRLYLGSPGGVFLPQRPPCYPDETKVLISRCFN
jgi:hypothetical protein